MEECWLCFQSLLEKSMEWSWDLKYMGLIGKLKSNQINFQFVGMDMGFQL